ncbi:tripartite tricarboxylate transporter permease [Georgenia sp. Z1491]|uniref:tripartite tricarboxylate transporter permease n=1 Tax=Georgenia sp. Z1491 TaxID=3416707 RepID=UPI003CF580AE
MLEAASSALSSLLDPATLVFLGAGIVAGLVIGIIPGLGGTGAVAILLPFIFVLEPNQALALMIGAVAVVHTSDTIASVLMGIPGSASATVLMLDGHEMAKQGMAARALAIAFLSSMFGGLLGALGLTLSIPIARPLVLSFGSPELFMLTVLGISITALLSKGNMMKGLLAGAFGVLLGQIGGAPAAPDYRFTFDSLFLTEGLDLVAVALGIFGIAEVISRVAKKTSVATGMGIGQGWGTGIKDVFSNFGHVLRGALVGIWAGVLPGLGATAGTWMAYGQAKASMKGKDRKKFGKGDPRGIIAPESANNSVEAGDLIPTLLFGIPGGAPAALLLGALLIFGIEPGPRIIEDNLDTVYVIVWSFAIASVVGAALCFFLAAPLAKLSFVRFPVIAGGLIVILFMAGYQDSKEIQLLLVMLALGIIGWLMKIAHIPRAPFLIGFVLAVPLERYYYLTENLYTPAEWLVRPAVIVMIIILLVPVALAVYRRVRARRDPDVPGLMPDDDDDAEGGESAEPPAIWRVVIAAAFLLVFVGAFVLAQDFSQRARLVPSLITALGAVLAAIVLVMELRNRRKIDADVDRAEWRQELRWVLSAFSWLISFIVLVYVLGMLLAAVVFIPVFLRVVAEMKWWHIAVYTAVTIAVMVALREFADIGLPIGYLTPVGIPGIV